jgi:hypothetical protein
MNLEQHDRRQIEHLLRQVQTEWQNARRVPGVPIGMGVVLSNGLQVDIALEAGVHAGQGEPEETRLWLGVSRDDRLPTVREIESVITLVFTASQRGSSNPLAISTARHTPNQVLCSSRLRHDPRAA